MLCLVGARLGRAVRETLRKLVNLGKLMIELRGVEERSHIESCILVSHRKCVKFTDGYRLDCKIPDASVALIPDLRRLTI